MDTEVKKSSNRKPPPSRAGTKPSPRASYVIKINWLNRIRKGAEGNINHFLYTLLDDAEKNANAIHLNEVEKKLLAELKKSKNNFLDEMENMRYILEDLLTESKKITREKGLERMRNRRTKKKAESAPNPNWFASTKP